MLWLPFSQRAPMTILLYWCNSLFLVGDCRGKRPFQFFNIWSDRDGFLDVIRSVWDTTIQGCCSYQISPKLKILRQLLRDKYGKDQIQIDIAKAKADLLDVQNQMHSYPEKSKLASKESAFASHLRLIILHFSVDVILIVLDATQLISYT